MQQPLVLRRNVFELLTRLAVDLAAHFAAARAKTLGFRQFVGDRLAGDILGNLAAAVPFFALRGRWRRFFGHGRFGGFRGKRRQLFHVERERPFNYRVRFCGDVRGAAGIAGGERRWSSGAAGGRAASGIKEPHIRRSSKVRENRFEIPRDNVVPAAKKLAEAELAVETKSEEEVAALASTFSCSSRWKEKKVALQQGKRGGAASRFYAAKFDRESAEISLLKNRIKAHR